jgi:hypothetical protein
MPYRSAIKDGVTEIKWLRNFIKKAPKEMSELYKKDLQKAKKDLVQDRASQKAFEKAHGGKNMDQLINSALRS